MSKKQIVVAVLVLVMAFAAGVVLYQYWNPFSGSQEAENVISEACPDIPGQGGMGAGTGFNRMVSILDLSEDQITVFSKIERQYRQQMLSLMGQLDSVDQHILEEVKREKPDKTKLDDLAVTAGQIQYEIKKATADHLLEVKNICNPDQRARFDEVISEINQFRRGRGYGNGQGYGRGGKRKGWRNR